MIELVIRTLPAEDLTPLRAYAALRAQTPGRSSFLFESTSAEPGRGRYSVLGYRARAESVYPGGGNALTMIAEDVLKEEVSPGFAAHLSQSLVGYIAYDAVNAVQKVEPWPDEGDLARVMRDSTVVLFDAVEKTMTIAGRTKNAVDRCAWEMTHGPALMDLPSVDPEAEAEHVDAQMDDAMVASRIERGRRHIDSGAASRIVFARLFKAPFRGSDAFDVYRALRELDPAPYHFFLEFCDTPMAEGFAIAGTSLDGDLSDAMAAAADPVKALHEAVPGGAHVGEPMEKVPAIIREIEPSSRGMFGGSVGYVGPGGVIGLATTKTVVVAKKGFFETRAGISLAAGDERGNEVAALKRAARPALAAIRAAQEAAKKRDAAEKAARAEEAAKAKASESS